MTSGTAGGRTALGTRLAPSPLPSLDHTIVRATDPTRSGQFLADLLGMNVGRPTGLFTPVRTGNGVTLDFMAAPAAATAGQHLAFAVTEQQFDDILGRLVAHDIDHYADPYGQQTDRINHAHGGRGLYFHDADGINIEIQTIADGRQAG